MTTHKILIIDDDSEILFSINSILTQLNKNYEILNATNVFGALKIISQESPDLIITDWIMPELTGIDLIKILKNNINTARIPIIICTGVMLEQQHIVEALNLGAIDFIKKPIEKTEFIARVSTMMQFVEINNLYLKGQIEKSEIEKKLIEEQLIGVTKEAEARIFLVLKYNELLTNSLDLLKDIPNCECCKCANQIENVISTISTGIYNHNWENLVVSFDRLYPTFFKRLNETYPFLSKNETRLCAFIKLKISTKEICALTMQEYRAVEMSRHRLRKKMGIARDKQIFDFLP